MNLREYQIYAVKALSRTHRGIIKAPAGSGKTIIAAAALNEWSGSRYETVSNKLWKVAWVANTTEQVEQGRKALDAMLIWGNLAIDFFCYSGCPSLSGYDLAIFDECHHLPAPEFRKCVNYHDGARWGLSATPHRADELKEDVYKLIGPIVHTVDRAPLVEAGQITEARVIIHDTNDKGEFEREVESMADVAIAARKRKWPFLFRSPKMAKEQEKRIIWQLALSHGVENNRTRNERVIALAGHHRTDSTLILVGKIEHGEFISKQIPFSMVVHSKLPAKSRREAISAFQNGELRCMIATSLADEGLDVPRANVLIQVSAGRSAAKAEQRTGRVLRAFHDKSHGIIHDFSDLGHYFLAAQSRRRIAVYKSLGYSIALA